MRWTIPDDEMVDWIRILREGDLAQPEIDRILCCLNQTYRRIKSVDLVEIELARFKELLYKRCRKVMSPEEERRARASIRMELERGT